MNIDEILEKMTLVDKIRLCTGSGSWQTKAMEYGFGQLFLCDGPHGLRKMPLNKNQSGLRGAAPATCFPTASCAAATWDTSLQYRIGRAIGLEAVGQGADVVLGPGVNMKRNPLCGRNFEYYSEDPHLAGKLGAAWVRGVQETGTGVSLKHFAVNSQEHNRNRLDALVDQRTLREYYLPAFETVVKEAQPTTVMCAYNKVNGTYCSDHKELLTDILRGEWGFDGLVVSDWGAMHDRTAAFQAGCDLEMPDSRDFFTQKALAAVKNGLLSEETIDRSVRRVLNLMDRTANKAAVPEDWEEQNHALALQAAREGGVLLKNDGLLPLAPGSSVAVIGTLAQRFRFQGAGSSQVTATRTARFLDCVEAFCPGAQYAPGYTLDGAMDRGLIESAAKCAAQAQTVIFVLGQGETDESEGYDRPNMDLAENQLRALAAVLVANPNVAVVMVGGSPVKADWADRVPAILHMQLSGQAGSQAAAEILFGQVNPSGKLAETYPVDYDDVPSSHTYGKDTMVIPHREAMFCGYRYFDSANVPVRWPFGYGLSYTTFRYCDLRVRPLGGGFSVTVTVENTGAMDGAEIVQLYVAPKTGGAFRPARELRGFARVHIPAGGSAQVTMTLTPRDFAIYDPTEGYWMVESGDYELQVAASSRDIRLTNTVTLRGEAPRRSTCSGWYYTLEGKPTDEDFISLYGDFAPYVPKVRGEFTMENSVRELMPYSVLARTVARVAKQVVIQRNNGIGDENDPNFRMMYSACIDSPMLNTCLLSEGSMSEKLGQAVVDSANGHTLRGIVGLIKKK